MSTTLAAAVASATCVVSPTERRANSVWMDIKQTNVLNVQQARESQDEKHICPLQLDLIARAVELWSRPGETVFTPFLGIGSEVFQSLRGAAAAAASS